jgi:hypothetical protein
LFIDMLGANLVGCMAGVLILRFLNHQEFEWADDVWGRKGSFRGTLARTFLPFSWHEYSWHFFKSPFRLLLAVTMVTLTQLFQTNSFFLFHIFQIPAENKVNGYRMLLLWPGLSLRDGGSGARSQAARCVCLWGFFCVFLPHHLIRQSAWPPGAAEKEGIQEGLQEGEESHAERAGSAFALSRFVARLLLSGGGFFCWPAAFA